MAHPSLAPTLDILERVSAFRGFLRALRIWTNGVLLR